MLQMGRYAWFHIRTPNLQAFVLFLTSWVPIDMSVFIYCTEDFPRLLRKSPTTQINSLRVKVILYNAEEYSTVSLSEF